MNLELSDFFGWIFSVVAAFIAYWAATSAHRDTTRDSDKDIFVTAVTNERAKWREEFRDCIADYMKQCLATEHDISELLRLRANIVLRLNPRARGPHHSEQHKLDMEVFTHVEALFEAKSTGKAQSLDANLIGLEESAQKLLKQEWDKSKEEAATGRERSEGQIDRGVRNS